MKKFEKNTGFTLVELMVSVGITAIMMVGIATFFSSTFRNMFLAREQVTSTQGQFVVTTILNGKFENVEALDDSAAGFAVLQNGTDSGDLPFTYISTESVGPEEYAVFKDFFVFNGMFGNSPSTNSGLTNPGDVTRIGAGDYYVTSPTTNEIYKCTNANMTGCSPFSTSEDLDLPIGVTNDGTDIYVTDAGNDRVIKIEVAGGTVTEVVTDLSFPTGIQFYSPSGTDYLFVSDTYNHLVKKVDIAVGLLDPTDPSAWEVVVGDGSDELCDPSDGRDHSASNCKLNFPTGLVTGDDGSGEALYIADTGNDRVLKVSDAGYPSDFTMEFLSPDVDEAIKEINFAFPAGTDMSIAVLDDLSSDGDELRDTGGEDFSGNEFTYELWTTLLDDTVNTNACSPQPCSDTMDKIEVANPDLFNSTDYKDLYMDSESLEVQSKGGQILDLVNDFSSHQLIGEVVTLTNLIPGDTNITFDLEDVDTTGASAGFSEIEIDLIDEDDVSLLTTPRLHPVRIGDGELGTFEDTISVYADGIAYPTGLGFYAGAPQYSSIPNYSTSFSAFDYTSNFEVQNFAFSTLNGGTILELSFEANLGEDVEGNELWEDYTLNADLTP